MSFTLPWAQIQTYLSLLKTHDTQLSMIVKLKDDGILDVGEVETKISKILIQFIDVITKILKDYNLIYSEGGQS